MINKFFVKTTDTIRSTIKKISDSGMKCVIVHENNKLIGTISDGDIRKVLIKKISLNSTIKKFYNKSPKYLVYKEYSEREIKDYFKKYNLDIIPVIDNKKIIKSVIDRNYFFSKRFSEIRKLKVPTIIMAGGLGTRLKPITNIIPKPLVPYRGIPIIEQILNNFFEQGIKDFYLTLNFKYKIIETYVKEIAKENMKINIIKELVPRGTASSLKQIKNKIKNDFFVTNCDVLFNLNYEDLIKFHKKNKNLITVVGAKKNIKMQYGICKVGPKNKLKKIDEKPSVEFIVSTGLYVVNSKVLKFIPKNKIYNFDTLISDTIKKKLKIGVYEIDDKSWIDVGDWSGFKKNINF